MNIKIFLRQSHGVGFGIFTCILERLLNCAVNASCGECIMCEVA